MSRLVFALICAFFATGCASSPKPLPVHLDPSNPDAPEAPVASSSGSLSPSAAAPDSAGQARSDHSATGSGAAANQTQGAVYSCPMHPEVRSDKPGECPKCGMKLELQGSGAAGRSSSTAPASAATPAASSDAHGGSHEGYGSPQAARNPSAPAPSGHGDHTSAAGASSTRAKEAFSCPMHPEVRSDMPGKCPKCGMKLVQEKPAPRAAASGVQHSPPAAGSAAPAKTIYSCPMHPEVRADKPGKCPKCGMNLVAEKSPPDGDATPGGTTRASTGGTATTAESKSKTVYSCPMHPEVRSDKPGKCPKCGMNLVMEKPAQKPDGGQPPAVDHSGHGGGK